MPRTFHHLKYPSIIDKAMAHVEFDTNGGCWLYPVLSEDGYARVHWNRRPYAAHRLMYEHTKGSVPDGLQVLHRCDVRACCNPDHLFVGTQLDNMRDMQKKKRWSKTKAGASSSLSPEDVIAIRRRYDNGEHPQKIAEDYGVCRQTAWRVGERRFFRYIKEVN